MKVRSERVDPLLMMTVFLGGALAAMAAIMMFT